MQAYESVFGIAQCPVSYFDMMLLPRSYQLHGSPNNTPDTAADELAQPYLRPVSRGNTNNTPESDIVSANYIWSVAMEHPAHYTQQEKGR
jgi:hypothetical protein